MLMKNAPMTDTKRPTHSKGTGTWFKIPQSASAWMTELRFAIAKAGPATPVLTAILMHKTPVPAIIPDIIPRMICCVVKAAYPAPLIVKMIPIMLPNRPSTIRKTALAEIPSI